ncbi:MAG: hypothetical protein ABIH21_01355 [Patescibacteria group bacterium]
MNAFWQILIIFLHTLIGWVGVEVYVNNFHSLPRLPYIILHYFVVFVLFALVFSVHSKFIHPYSAFTTTAVMFFCLLIIEFVIFRFVYSGELWFFNYIDWIVPMFCAISAVYLAETFVRG